MLETLDFFRLKSKLLLIITIWGKSLAIVLSFFAPRLEAFGDGEGIGCPESAVAGKSV